MAYRNGASAYGGGINGGANQHQRSKIGVASAYQRKAMKRIGNRRKRKSMA